jgi:hypothetical protein
LVEVRASFLAKFHSIASAPTETHSYATPAVCPTPVSAVTARCIVDPTPALAIVASTMNTPAASPTPTPAPTSNRIYFGYDEVKTHGEWLERHCTANQYLGEVNTYFTRNHWLLDPNTRMRVHLAKQLFCKITFSSFAKVAQNYPDEHRWRALVFFMQAVRKIYLLVFMHKSPIVSLNDPRIRTLMEGMCFFELWFYDVHLGVPGQQKTKNKHFISPKTWFQLRVTVTGLCRFLQSRLATPGKIVIMSILTQSPLEGFFGFSRGTQGGHGKLTEVTLHKAIGIQRFTKLDTLNTRKGQKRSRDPTSTDGDAFFAQERLVKRVRGKRRNVQVTNPR